MLRIVNGQQVLVDDETGEILDQVFFKTPYNHDRDAESERTGLVCNDESLADQSFKEDADINVIMDRVKKGAEIPITLPEHFGDGTQIPDLLEAHTKIAENNRVFYNLDPRIREEFMNDPMRWMVQVRKDLDEANLDNLKRMGMDVSDLTVIAARKPPAAPQGGSPAPGAPATPGAADSPPPGPTVTP